MVSSLLELLWVQTPSFGQAFSQLEAQGGMCQLGLHLSLLKASRVAGMVGPQACSPEHSTGQNVPALPVSPPVSGGNMRPLNRVVMDVLPDTVTPGAGLWVGDCFIYNNSAWWLNYCVGGEVTTMYHLDRPMYLLGYLASQSKVYLIDKVRQLFCELAVWCPSSTTCCPSLRYDTALPQYAGGPAWRTAQHHPCVCAGARAMLCWDRQTARFGIASTACMLHGKAAL